MLKTKKHLFILGIFIAGCIVVLDQIAKLWITKLFSYGEVLPVTPWFSFTLRHNTGAAFSFLAESSGWQRWFFVSFAIVVSVVLLLWLYRLNNKQKWEGVGLALILGGAIGNLIDRLYLGSVVDFLLLHYKGWEWPAFNVADSAITVGVVLLIVGMFQS